MKTACCFLFVCSQTVHTRAVSSSSPFTFRQIIRSNHQRYSCSIPHIVSAFQKTIFFLFWIPVKLPTWQLYLYMISDKHSEYSWCTVYSNKCPRRSQLHKLTYGCRSLFLSQIKLYIFFLNTVGNVITVYARTGPELVNNAPTHRLSHSLKEVCLALWLIYSAAHRWPLFNAAIVRTLRNLDQSVFGSQISKGQKRIRIFFSKFQHSNFV